MRTSNNSHILDVLNYHKSILTVTGVWPVHNPSWSYRAKKYFSWSIDISLQFFLFGELFKTLTNHEYKELTALMSLMGSYVSWVIKRTIFEFKYKKFMNHLDKLEDPILHNFPKDCEIFVQKENGFTLLFSRCFLFFAGMMVVLAFLKPLGTKELSVQFSLFELGPFFYPFHCYQTLTMANTCYNNATMDCVAMAFMSIGSVQFDILKTKLTNCRKWAGLTISQIDDGVANDKADMDSEFDIVLNNYLKYCVIHHLKIISLLEDVEDVFSYLLLSQFTTSVLAICNTWFQFMYEDDLLMIMFYIVYAIALLYQLGLYCIYGNNIMLKSEEIRDACYFSEWYRSNKSVRKTIMLIMERAKRPTVITAGKLSVVNLVTYTGLIRMSYSYFALMNNISGN